MKKFCPHCHCEMLERANLYICPRNAIGDCVYDAMLTNEQPLISLPLTQNAAILMSDLHPLTHNQSRSCVTLPPTNSTLSTISLYFSK